MSGPTRALQEAELTSAEVERILKVCGPHALLVGGQALATWAVYYGIQPAGELSRVVTMDADFIGSNATAQKLQRSLGQPWKLRRATLDDFGPQVAKVTKRAAFERRKSRDEANEKMRRRAKRPSSSKPKSRR